MNSNVEYYSDLDVAKLLNLSVGRLRNKISRGENLPRRIQPPGCRHRLWLKKEVHRWLEQYSVSSNIEKSSIRRVSRK